MFHLKFFSMKKRNVILASVLGIAVIGTVGYFKRDTLKKKFKGITDTLTSLF